MSGNTFGKIFKVTTFGESHGQGLGGVVDGCPAGIELSESIIQTELDKRKPGGGGAATTRKEADAIKIYSGIFEGKTTGTPIGFYIENTSQRSGDYSNIKDIYRPGHADFTFDKKYGARDYRGGGRSSGRETVSRVAAGGVAKEVLKQIGVECYAYTTRIGGIDAFVSDIYGADNRPFFSPDDIAVDLWNDLVAEVRKEGDTLGGVVEICVKNVPAGLGEPVFDKLDARLAYALMSVGAVKGVEVGAGFAASDMRGSDNNDQMDKSGFLSNHAGGILGGISNGQDIIVRAYVKPIPSISIEQRTVTRDNKEEQIRVGGRHDICAIPRIVPVLKAMTMLTITDLLLCARAGNNNYSELI